jgi:uncharacterized membrane protein YGL010W
MSETLVAQFQDYSSFHRTAGNKACHFVGIPLIVLSLLALLSTLRIASFDAISVTAAEVLLALSLVYYLTLDVPLALLMLLAAGGLDALGRLLPWQAALALFVFGWILQFVGHYRYEKRAPAFYRNLVHLLVGPLWILAQATGRVPARAGSASAS